MNIAELSIKKKTITIVFTILLFFGGLHSYSKLGRLEDPEFTIKNAKVITYYPGASAEEVELEVTDEIETAIQKLGQLKKITSISMPGYSSIEVEIRDKYDKETLPQVWDELRRKVNDTAANLPQGASKPYVWDDFGDVYGIFYALYGDGYSMAELKEYAKLLKRELLLVQDVADVKLFGEQQEVVYIEISNAKLSQLGIGPQAIFESLAGQNMISNAGNVTVGNQYLRITPSGELDSIEDIGNVLILSGSTDSSKLYLSDIAEIKRGYQDPPTVITHFNGKPAIGLGISTIQGGNVVVMGNAVKQRIGELIGEIPVGVELEAISHQGENVVTAINGFLVNLIEAIIIVIAVLIFAMGFRSSLIIGGVLLLTVLATFILMKINNVMLERISLGALIIALGMLVDNAIVVVEGIIVNSQKGMSKLQAASQIVTQTMWPLFGATIVAIMAFAAIGVSQDSTGEYCRSLFQVLLYSLTLSWILAITLTPLLGVSFLKANKEGDSQDVDPYKGVLFKVYRAMLVFCMKKRVITITVLIGMLVAAIYGFGFVDKSFFPDSTRPQFMIHYWLPQGTHIKTTEKDVAEIEEYILTYDGVQSVSASIGQGTLRFLLTYTPEVTNSAYGMLLVSVDNYKEIPTMMAKTEEYLKERYPDAQAFCRKFMLGPGDANKIQARLRGADKVILRDLSEQVVEIMQQEPHAVDINTDWRQRVTQVRPIVSDIQARNVGVTRDNIASAFQFSSDGYSTGYYRENDELLPMIVRLPEEERNNVADLKNTVIYSPVGKKNIPIGQIVTELSVENANQIVARYNRLATLTVRCDPKSGPASAVFERIRPKVEAIELPEGYSLEWGGEYEDSTKAQSALASKLPLVFIGMVLVVIVLFNSIKKPAIIFLVVPLAIIGVTVGLLLTHQPFGFMALLGFLSLTGMLIKNSIVLIDEINIQIASGKDPFTAIADSGVSRLRPVSMAAATTVLGMAPLLTDAFFIAMAVTIMFGLAFATVLTLIVVPVLYTVMYRIKPKAD